MAYIGRGPTNSGEFIILDDISSGFDGSDTSFTLTVGTAEVTPAAANVTIALDGVIQTATSAYSVTGSTINFSEAPASGQEFHGVLAGQSQYISNSSITDDHISGTANISGSKINTDFSAQVIKGRVFAGMISGSDQVAALATMTLATASIAAITSSVAEMKEFTKATTISGSFTALSGSVATRFDSRETDMTLATASIAAITASVATLKGNVGQELNTDSDVTFGTVTSGDINSSGTITATEIHTTFVSSSITIASGSNNFGDDASDHHSFTGSLSVSGSGTITGSLTVNGDLVLKDNADFNGDLDVDGTTNLDVVDIDGAVDMASTLTLGDDLTIPQKIIHAGDTNTFLSFADDALSLTTGGTQVVEFIYGNIYIKENNKALVGYTVGGSAKELIKIDASDAVQIGEALNVTMTGSLSLGDNITQSKAGNLTHTMTAGGSGEAALRLIANNTTGDPFIRFETNAKTFCMGIDNSDSDKFMLDLGSDPGADTIFNVQPDGSVITFDKTAHFGNTVQVTPNGAKFSVGAAITGSCGTGMDVIQVGHTSQWYAETGDAADRNVYIGNNFYHDGTNHHTIYEDEVSGLQFRAGTIRFRTEGVTAPGTNLDAGGGTERMRILSNGAVCIARTSVLSPAAKLVVSAAADGGTTPAASLQANTSTSSGAVLVFHSGDGSEAGSVALSNLNAADAVSYGTSSDYRLKHKIKILPNALDRVKQMKPVEFEWKKSKSKSEGFIAHELQEICDYAVTGEKDGDRIQQVDYAKITPILVKAVQELSEQITELKKEIKELKD